ncbi:AraC family transcriptional regulator [Serratia marcescens]|uniref:AraC family transcriptional regulator n=1 Tax=Serratia marcescens TaxID=615 RepID=UPI0011E6C49B|nr:helix-turn-helix domain-containing protein [Serratia marcescens]
MDYRKSVFIAMNYISLHLDDNPTFAKVADVAALSPFHFHRIFKAVTGETIACFTRRLRLERIARSLVDDSNNNVTHLAFQYGYSSSQNFAKVFRRHFGCSPSEYRQRRTADNNRKIGNAIIARTGYDRSTLYWDYGAGALEARMAIKIIPARHVVFMRQMGTYGKENCETAHAELLALLGREPLLHPVGTVSLYWDLPEITAAGYGRTDICLDVSPCMTLSRHLATQHIAGGTYAVCSFSPLSAAKISQAWELAFLWLAALGWEYSVLPCYELYHCGTDPQRDHYIVDIYIPLIKAR